MSKTLSFKDSECSLIDTLANKQLISCKNVLGKGGVIDGIDQSEEIKAIISETESIIKKVRKN